MKNKRLVEIIKDPGIATEKEIKVIKSLSSDYSYSPFLKVLQARIDQIHDKKSKSKSLSRAAIYIADRTVLRDFITNDKSLVISSRENRSVDKEKETKESRDQAAIQTAIPAREVKKKVKNPPVEVDRKEAINEEKDAVQSDRLKDEETVENTSTIAEELDKVVKEKKDVLRGSESKGPIEDIKEKDTSPNVVEIRDKLEEILHTTPKGKKGKKDEVSDGESKVMDPAEQERDDIVREEGSKASGMSKAGEDALSSEIMKNISELKRHKASLFRMLELEGPEDGHPEMENDSKSTNKKKSKKDKHHKKSKEPPEPREELDFADDYPEATASDEGEQAYPGYEEEDPKVIKDFLDKLEKDNPPPKRKLKKEEQEALIEKFIKSDPTMKDVRSAKEIPDKKDLSLPSVKFRDDIISENLANIMVKQGKHNKAIDIYKKLIWKFPQKKTYFAAQIEELKKKSGN